MLLLKSFLAWLVILCLAVANGALREAILIPSLGKSSGLILSGVLHIDVPPGNVPLPAVKALEKHPMVAGVIPISLGDNLRNFRIVGTSHAYAEHYGATLAQGRLWDTPIQVVLGAGVARKLGLALGATFAGSHGLAAGGVPDQVLRAGSREGHHHGEHHEICRDGGEREDDLGHGGDFSFQPSAKLVWRHGGGFSTQRGQTLFDVG